MSSALNYTRSLAHQVQTDCHFGPKGKNPILTAQEPSPLSGMVWQAHSSQRLGGKPLGAEIAEVKGGLSASLELGRSPSTGSLQVRSDKDFPDLSSFVGQVRGRSCRGTFMACLKVGWSPTWSGSPSLIAGILLLFGKVLAFATKRQERSREGELSWGLRTPPSSAP